jgi:hypothetical protein
MRDKKRKKEAERSGEEDEKEQRKNPSSDEGNGSASTSIFVHSNKDAKDKPGDVVDGGAAGLKGTGASGTAKAAPVSSQPDS